MCLSRLGFVGEGREGGGDLMAGKGLVAGDVGEAPCRWVEGMWGGLFMTGVTCHECYCLCKSVHVLGTVAR